MNEELLSALSDLCKEKGIDKEVILQALEAALIAAYKKNFASAQNVCASVDRETGKISVAYEGELDKSVDSDRLRDRLKVLQNKHAEETHIKHFARKARVKR